MKTFTEQEVKDMMNDVMHRMCGRSMPTEDTEDCALIRKTCGKHGIKGLKTMKQLRETPKDRRGRKKNAGFGVAKRLTKDNDDLIASK